MNNILKTGSLSVFMGAIGILCNVSKMLENGEFFQTKKSFNFNLKSNQKAKVKQ